MKRWLMMGLLSLVASGCATTPSQPPVPNRQEMLERASSQVLYRRAPEEVLETARAVLNAHGYTVLPSADPYYVRTGWKIEGNPDISSRWSRLLLHGRRLADGRFVLRAYEQVKTTVGRAPPHPSLGNGTRDKGQGTAALYVEGEPLSAAPVVMRRAGSVEWEVLSRLEPRFTEAVERQVDVYVANHQPPEELDGVLEEAP